MLKNKNLIILITMQIFLITSLNLLHGSSVFGLAPQHNLQNFVEALHNAKNIKKGEKPKLIFTLDTNFKKINELMKKKLDWCCPKFISKFDWSSRDTLLDKDPDIEEVQNNRESPRGSYGFLGFLLTFFRTELGMTCFFGALVCVVLGSVGMAFALIFLTPLTILQASLISAWVMFAVLFLIINLPIISRGLRMHFKIKTNTGKPPKAYQIFANILMILEIDFYAISPVISLVAGIIVAFVTSINFWYVLLIGFSLPIVLILLTLIFGAGVGVYFLMDKIRDKVRPIPQEKLSMFEPYERNLAKRLSDDFSKQKTVKEKMDDMQLYVKLALRETEEGEKVLKGISNGPIEFYSQKLALSPAYCQDGNKIILRQDVLDCNDWRPLFWTVLHEFIYLSGG